MRALVGDRQFAPGGRDALHVDGAKLYIALIDKDPKVGVNARGERLRDHTGEGLQEPANLRPACLGDL
ncbi:hypothetical protein PSAB6_10039 [Paraburkholderia sabiae]|nr:hypothetical protein PSAB6_10039 [Paraburkholderia sabiae]